MIVEDEETVVELLSEIFSDTGDYEVRQARDGEEALKTARAAHPDVILLDIQLPKRNSHDVCELVKSDPVMSCNKVVVIGGIPQNAY